MSGGEVVTLRPAASETVLDLKRSIHAHCPTAATQWQRLLLEGLELDNAQTFRELDCTSAATVQMVLSSVSPRDLLVANVSAAKEAALAFEAMGDDAPSMAELFMDDNSMQLRAHEVLFALRERLGDTPMPRIKVALAPHMEGVLIPFMDPRVWSQNTSTSQRSLRNRDSSHRELHSLSSCASKLTILTWLGAPCEPMILRWLESLGRPVPEDAIQCIFGVLRTESSHLRRAVVDALGWSMVDLTKHGKVLTDRIRVINRKEKLHSEDGDQKLSARWTAERKNLETHLAAVTATVQDLKERSKHGRAKMGSRAPES